MTLVLTAPPAVEPLTLAEAKAHLRVDTPSEDLLISALIATSRLQIETALMLALIDQSWSLFMDDWPRAATPLSLPIAPVRSISVLRSFDVSNAPTSLDPALLQLDPDLHHPRVVSHGIISPLASRRALNGIEIGLLAGFGPTAAHVPAPIRHALLLLVAHWFEQRGGEVGSEATRIPDAVSALLLPWRRPRLT